MFSHFSTQVNFNEVLYILIVVLNKGYVCGQDNILIIVLNNLYVFICM